MTLDRGRNALFCEVSTPGELGDALQAGDVVARVRMVDGRGNAALVAVEPR